MNEVSTISTEVNETNEIVTRENDNTTGFDAVAFGLGALTVVGLGITVKLITNKVVKPLVKKYKDRNVEVIDPDDDRDFDTDYDDEIDSDND